MNLNELGVHEENTIRYMSFVGPGDGELDPADGCTEGSTAREKVHLVTPEARSRVRITTIGDGTPNLNTVLYVRETCDDAASELVCNDDFGGPQSLVEVRDAEAGKPLYIVVDSGDVQEVALPQNYGLNIAFDPIVLEGAECDPTQGENVCQSGMVCSVADGDPICAPSLGGPTVTGVTAMVGENGTSLFIPFTGTDPDGDVLVAGVEFIDGTGAILYDVPLDTDDQLPGSVDIDTRITLYGAGSLVTDTATIRLRLIDSEGNMSDPMSAPLDHLTLVGIDGACDEPLTECAGELSCDSKSLTCTVRTATENACTAADGTDAVGPGSHMVTIEDSDPDLFQGSCWYNQGYGEGILRIEVPGPKHVQLIARTDVEPSPSADDHYIDSYIYLRKVCSDPTSELACNDDLADAASSSAYYYASGILVDDVEPGIYYLIVDGSYEGSTSDTLGDIGVSVEMRDLKDPEEACDITTDLCTAEHVCFSGACTETTAAVTATCEGATVVPEAGGTFTGEVSLTTDLSLFEGTCRYSTGWPERLFTLTLTEASMVEVSTDGSATHFDTVVYILEGCGTDVDEAACADDIGTDNWRSSTSAMLDPGTYTIVVDMSSPSTGDATGDPATDPSEFSVDVTVTPM